VPTARGRLSDPAKLAWQPVNESKRSAMKQKMATMRLTTTLLKTFSTTRLNVDVSAFIAWCNKDQRGGKPFLQFQKAASHLSSHWSGRAVTWPHAQSPAQKPCNRQVRKTSGLWKRLLAVANRLRQLPCPDHIRFSGHLQHGQER